MEEEKKAKLHSILNSANALKEVMQQLYNDDTYFAGKYVSFKELASKYNILMQELKKDQIGVNMLSFFRTDKMKSSGSTVWPVQKEIIDAVYTNLSLLISIVENSINIKKDERENLKNFVKVNLRKAIYNTPENEKTIQNALESLLVGKGLVKGLDYDRETGRVKIASKEVIPDFIFMRMNLALEVKIIKEKDRISKVIDEINADIIAYTEKYSSILFVIYDLGIIRDEEEFLSGFNNKNNVDCIIVKH